MKEKYIKKLEGKYCKIVTKEPGDYKASVVSGKVENIDIENGFILINSEQGLGALRLDTIIAIKPSQKIKKRPIKKIVKDEKAMVGIGTLIVFIAMILIAAVAASVLIQTSETLQQRAKTVGTQTIREVSAGLTIEDICGYTNPEKTKIQYLAIRVRPRAGSKDIDLNMTYLAIKYENISILKLDKNLVVNVNIDNKSVFETPVASGSNYTIIGNLTKTTFGVIVLHDADNSVTNTYGLNSGDKILLMVDLTSIIPDTNGLPTRKTISGEFYPELGAPGVFEFTSPSVFSYRVADLW